MAERAEDSAGLGGGGEEFGHVGVAEEVFELAGAAADVVVGAAGEPGVAGGEIGFGRALAGLGGAVARRAWVAGSRRRLLNCSMPQAAL